MGYIQASVGIGLMLGPVLGEVLYSLVQFEKTFYIFGSIIMSAMIFLIFVIPSEINHADDIMSIGEVNEYFERLKSTEGRSTSFERQRPAIAA